MLQNNEEIYLDIQQLLMELTTSYIWLFVWINFQQKSMMHISTAVMVGAIKNGVIKRKKW